VIPGPFEAGYSELRGDIYFALGRNVDARESYLAAQQAGSASDILQLKLSQLPNDN
jgi:predicted negative regulator of RcsB-dependent stress response